MATWRMGLEPDPWERTRAGKKPVEFRLNKPVWGDMVVGDIIKYGREPERMDIIRVEVLEIIRRPTFGELLDYCYQHGYVEKGRDKHEQLQSLETRCAEEERSQYSGVLGIRAKVINIAH